MLAALYSSEGSVMEVRLNVEQCVLTTDIDRRCQNLRHLYPLHGGSNWVYSGFSHNQNSRDLSAAYVPWSGVKINTRETPYSAQRL